MKQSFLATKTRKEAPADEIALNAQLLIRAGYIHKTMAGVYSFLPLGLRSYNKIVSIIREEMESIGGQELIMNGLQNPDVWEKSSRWSGEADEVWFRSQLASGGVIGLGWTHEEPITEMLQQHIHSYRDLPLYLYQIQTKFRNEKRAKSGIMRTREFVMKDLYSFCVDEEQHKEFYERCAEAYMRIFNRVGIGDDTYRTFASGGAFSEFSDEFQTVIPTGEDTIYIHQQRRIALNDEIYTDAILEKLKLKKEELKKISASEVGNIFTLGTRFSEALGLSYTTEDGDTKPVFMGSYGIGPTRLLGIIAEKYSAKDSLILPASVAPFLVHLLALGDSDDVLEEAEMVYTMLQERGISVLFDDRRISPGEKFADSDLLGMPYRFIISEKTRASGKVECLNRMTDEKTFLEPSAESLITIL